MRLIAMKISNSRGAKRVINFIITIKNNKYLDMKPILNLIFALFKK